MCFKLISSEILPLELQSPDPGCLLKHNSPLSAGVSPCLELYTKLKCPLGPPQFAIPAQKTLNAQK